MPKSKSKRIAREKRLTTGKAAELLQVTPTTVRGMCERGELEGAVRVGEWWRIPPSALVPYLSGSGGSE